MISIELYIQLSYCIICILEAWLEQVIIWLKNTKLANYMRYDKVEHRRSAMFMLSIATAFSLMPHLYEGRNIFNSVYLFISLLFIRRLFFDYSLKIFRGKRLFTIEGNGLVDRTLKGIFGVKGGWIEVMFCIGFILLFNILMK